MGEEPKNENKPEFKGNLGFIWLIGILVILLGCTIVYVFKLKTDVRDLKEIPQVPSTPLISTTQEQAKTQEETKNSNEINNTKSSKLVAINDEKGFNKEGEIYEFINAEEDSSDKSVMVSYVVNGKNKGKLRIRVNNKVVNEQKQDKEVIDIKSLDYYYLREIFILFNDGTVGKISVENINKGKYTINTVKNVKDIVSIQKLVFTNKDAGSDFIIVAVDNNGKTTLLDDVSD